MEEEAKPKNKLSQSKFESDQKASKVEFLNFKPITVLGPGKSFGEKALLSKMNHTRSAHVLWLSDCEFAVMTNKDFRDILGIIVFIILFSSNWERQSARNA